MLSRLIVDADGFQVMSVLLCLLRLPTAVNAAAMCTCTCHQRSALSADGRYMCGSIVNWQLRLVVMTVSGKHRSRATVFTNNRRNFDGLEAMLEAPTADSSAKVWGCSGKCCIVCSYVGMAIAYPKVAHTDRPRYWRIQFNLPNLRSSLSEIGVAI
jgi:hypothetical protein